ncbi:MAG: C39 family peptidase [Parcubacteria group bacterium]|nr:C39 family peptidase [Parcubacteria group bacterium]
MFVDVPFYRQLTMYNCGPAALQMVFAYFNRHRCQKELARSLRTSKRDGTTHDELVREARRDGFYCYTNGDSTLFEIKHFISLGLPVVVDFIEPDGEEEHYAVVVGYKDGDIILNDPWNGENFKLPEEEFARRWHYAQSIHKRWIMVLSSEPLVLGKRHAPRRKTAGEQKSLWATFFDLSKAIPKSWNIMSLRTPKNALE